MNLKLANWNKLTLAALILLVQPAFAQNDDANSTGTKPVEQSTATSASRPQSRTQPTTAQSEINGNKIALEVARTRKEVEHGLMERESMPEDHGMVFLFRPSRPERFWMVNCLMSLDMIFVKDGRIVTISEEAPPHRLGPPNRAPLYPSEGPVVVSEVIEVNPGYCKRHGIKSGDTVKLTLPDENEKKN